MGGGGGASSPKQEPNTSEFNKGSLDSSTYAPISVEGLGFIGFKNYNPEPYTLHQNTAIHGAPILGAGALRSVQLEGSQGFTGCTLGFGV